MTNHSLFVVWMLRLVVLWLMAKQTIMSHSQQHCLFSDFTITPERHDFFCLTVNHKITARRNNHVLFTTTLPVFCLSKVYHHTREATHTTLYSDCAIAKEIQYAVSLTSSQSEGHYCHLFPSTSWPFAGSPFPSNCLPSPVFLLRCLLLLLCVQFLVFFSSFFTLLLLLLLPSTSPPLPLPSSWVVDSKVLKVVSLHVHKLFLNTADVLQMGKIMSLFYD